MSNKQSPNILTLLVIVVVLAIVDYLLDILVDIDENSRLLLIILFLLALIILVLTFRIWQIILTEESKAKIQHKRFLLVAAILTVATGLTGLFIYSLEIVLSFGLLGGPAYYEIDPTAIQNETGIAFLLMFLLYLLKFIHNASAFIGCLLTSVIWTLQFRTWARFTEAPFIKSFYFVGMTMIVLFLDEIVAITLAYLSYGLDYESYKTGRYILLFEPILVILYLIAIVVLPVYIYFLATAEQRLRIPYEKEKSVSRLIIILPFIFFVLWIGVTISLMVEGTRDPSLIDLLINASLFSAIFIPISIGFFGWARRVDSVYLRKNLYLAAVGTFALSTLVIVDPDQSIGMTVLTGYLLAFSVLTWSFSNISQFLGSREALSRRLRKAGDQFLTELGKAEMKAQSLQKMATVMAAVSKDFMKDLVKMSVRTPPTKKEIRRYIVTTIGVEESLSQSEIKDYLDKAIIFVEKTPEKK